MSKQSSPAFQFYAADFLSDINVIVMTTEEIGAYTLLMAVCWREGFLPKDTSELARIGRLVEPTFNKAWESKIKRCFIQREDGCFIHPRLEKERQKQEEWRNKCVEGGKKSGESRRNGSSTSLQLTPQLPLNQNPTLQSSSSSSLNNNIYPEIEKSEKENAKRGKRPSTDMPAGFCLSEKMRKYALDHRRPDPDWEFERFCSHHNSLGSKFADWEQAWQTWVLKGEKWSKEKIGSDASDIKLVRGNCEGIC